jgi:hypothetical protein
MSRPSPTQLHDARNVLAQIIGQMPSPDSWQQASIAYLQGAVAGIDAALGLPAGSAPKEKKP